MRILQVGKHYFPEKGGIETVMFDLTEGLNKRGVECDVLCANTVNAFQLSYIENYKVYRAARITKLLSTSLSPEYIKLVRKLSADYDVLHVHLPDPMANFALMMAAKMKGKKVIVHWHSDIVNKKQQLFLPFYRPLQNWLLKKADNIICTSKQYLEASRELVAYRHKCNVVPIGIDIRHFENNNEALVNKLRMRYAGKKIIFSLGRHVYYKGFQYLIDAARKLPENVVVVIGGEGELTPVFLEQIVASGLTGKVELVGRIPQDELGAYFQVCDIFCLPSAFRSEAFGVVLLESMYYGKPVVATDIPGSGVNWVNVHGETGLNAPVADAEGLATCINNLLEDEKLYKACAENGRRRFHAYFTADAMIDAFMELYQR